MIYEVIFDAIYDIALIMQEKFGLDIHKSCFGPIPRKYGI